MKNIFPASCFLFTLIFTSAQAFELQLEKLTDNIYALVGEIGPRSIDNQALNNTLGFVVTSDGVVLVGSGATPAGAKLIEQAIARKTTQPVRWVVNIGVQDHHWMGNSYFAAKGAKIIALAKTAHEQQQKIANHLDRLQQALKAQTNTIKPLVAVKPIDDDNASLMLGGEAFELMWPGGGHFAGDAILWMPRHKVVFTGDYVFHDRMLGVQPYSQVLAWQKSFHEIAALNPRIVIPGHGFPADLAKAQRDTGDYLDWLVAEVSLAQQDWKEIGDTVHDLSEVAQFRHLKFYDDWHRKNINRTYLFFESQQ